MRHLYFPLALIALLAGCATPPLVIGPTHPASLDALEAAAPPARAALRADANTRRTRELLAQRARQAEAAESEPPADQTHLNPNAPQAATAPAPASTPAPKMKMPGHENH